jgi:hypothetical protein
MSARTVEEMMETLPKSELMLVKRLRAIVQECLPFATEKAYFGLGIPYYTHHRMICFIWPGSVGWSPKGPTVKENPKGTSLGFCYGNMMANEDGALLAEGRKQVYMMYFHSVSDIKEEQIRALLFEAALVDETFKRRRRKKRQRDREANNHATCLLS